MPSARVRVAASALAAWFGGCAVGDDLPRHGELHVALSGALPNVKSFTIRVYRGPVLALSQAPVFAPPCRPYGGAKDNIPVVRDLEAAGDYAVLVDGFSDTVCGAPVVRAYRGNIAVVAGTTEKTAALNPYWLPTVEFGKFTELAKVNPVLQETAGKKFCATEFDCRSVHANATCSNARCRVDHLFPLNGQARRGLPTAIGLEDGRVAILGGLGVVDAGYYKAAAEQVEVFDPRSGTFHSRTVGGSGSAVGLAQAVTVAGGAFAFAGGATSVKLALAADKLTAQLDFRDCAGAGGGSACAVSSQLGRWTVADAAAGSTAQQFGLGVPRAFPMIAPVATPQGDRLLVTGGSELPINATDKRIGKAMLCKVDAGTVDCPEQKGATMKAGRANAAVACAGRNAVGGCDKVLLVGGRNNGSATPLSEIYDGASNSFVTASDVGGAAVPQNLHGGSLYQIGAKTWVLVGATSKRLWLEDSEVTTGGDVEPRLVAIDAAANPPVLTWSKVELGAFAAPDQGKRLLAATVQLADGSVLVIGGLNDALKVATDAVWIGTDGKGRGRLPLQVPRFGASAARVGGKGPFAGCVVLAGGFALSGSAVEPLNQVELLCPVP